MEEIKVMNEIETMKVLEEIENKEKTLKRIMNKEEMLAKVNKLLNQEENRKIKLLKINGRNQFVNIEHSARYILAFLEDMLVVIFHYISDWTFQIEEDDDPITSKDFIVKRLLGEDDDSTTSKDFIVKSVLDKDDDSTTSKDFIVKSVLDSVLDKNKETALRIKNINFEKGLIENTFKKLFMDIEITINLLEEDKFTYEQLEGAGENIQESLQKLYTIVEFYYETFWFHTYTNRIEPFVIWLEIVLDIIKNLELIPSNWDDRGIYGE